MSATIGINDLKFVVFGSGHDYTLLNSGTGEGIRVFSHPYVPLGSSLYAGQFYFIVPDDNGNLIDAVKDDIAHCTFTPAIGSTFDAEGEQTVKVEYEREYIHDEETILIKRSFTEKVEVVDHGNVTANYGNKYTTYDDGYLFLHPSSTSVASAEMFYHNMYNASTLNVKKVSSLPWRVNCLGRKASNTDYGGLLTGCNWFDTDIWNYTEIDISELKYADVSNVTSMKYLFNITGSYILDYSALEDWDVSKVTDFESAFTNGGYAYDDDTGIYTYFVIDDLSFLSKWNVSSATNIKSIFGLYVRSLHGLENWDVSNVTDMTYSLGNMFLSDISALANWDVSDITDFTAVFGGSKSLENLHGIETWDVSNGTNFTETFYACASLGQWDGDPPVERDYVLDLSAIADWDMSSATNLEKMFAHTGVIDLTPLADWDVSNVTSMVRTFAQTPITSLEPLADWDVSSVTNMSYTFNFCEELQSLHGLEDWDVSSVTTFNQAGWGNSDGTFTCLHLTDISALANWDVSHSTSFKYMFEHCEWLFDITPLANWNMASGDLKFMFSDANVYYSSLLGKRVYYHALYGDTYYEDYQGNRYISGVSDSDHPLQLIDKNASSAQSWNVGSGSGKGAFPSNWINRPSWN